MSSIRNTELGFPQSHVFVIGINKYYGLNANLETAVSDAVEIAKCLKVLQGFDNVILMQDVSKHQINTLLDWLKNAERNTPLTLQEESFFNGEDEHRSNISLLCLEEEIAKQNIKELPQLILKTENTVQNKKEHKLYQVPVSDSKINIDSDDSIIFYYAGHGFAGVIKDGPSGFLAPRDATSKFASHENESLIPMDSVYKALSQIDCKHTLLVLDCCFAGRFRFASETRGDPVPFLMPMYKQRYLRYKAGKAWQVLASTGPDQKAADSAAWKNIRNHSPFAKTFIKALKGNADALVYGNKSRGDGIITVTELFLYVWDQVEEITAERKPQHPGLFPMKQHRTGEFIFLNPRMTSEEFKFAKDPDKNPYKGFLPYEPEDANLFFGRDKALKSLLRKIDIQPVPEDGQLLKKIKKPQLIFLTAPSASGKSSLIKAGLFPALQKKYAYEELLIFRPAHPDEIMGTSIIPDEEIHKGEYKREKWKGFDVLNERLDTSKNQIILIDQYEEFFTELDSKAIRDDFENRLLKIIENENEQRTQPLVLIITMRSDAEWQLKKTKVCSSKKTGKKYWTKDHIFRLQPMDLDELRQALTGPVWWALHDFKNEVGGDFKDDGEKLINQILKDVMYYPAALPLLSSVMHAFYEKAKENDRNQKLIRVDYDGKDGLNGVEGALSANAEKFYTALQDESERDLLKKIVLRMVRAGDAGYTRRRVTYMEPANQLSIKIAEDSTKKVKPIFELDFGKDQRRVKDLIDKMEAAFLVVQDKNHEGFPCVEPAHDALINHWDRCMEWLLALGKEHIILKEQLWEAVEEFTQWRQRMKPEIPDSQGPLWDNNPKLLQILTSIIDPDDKWLCRINGVKQPVNSLAYLLWNQAPNQGQLQALGAWNAYFKTDDPLERYQKVKDQMDNWLTREEIKFVRKSFEVERSELEQLKKERNIAQSSLLSSKALIQVEQDPTKANSLAHIAHAIAPSDETTETLIKFNLFSKHNFYKFKQIHSDVNELDEASPVCVCKFSPDGQYIASGSDDGSIVVWDKQLNKIKTLNPDQHGIITAIAFSSDGKKILSGGAQGIIGLWDLSSGLIDSWEAESWGCVNDITFFENDTWCAYGMKAGAKAYIQNLQNRTEFYELTGHTGNVNSIQVSRNNKTVLTACGDGIIRQFNISNKQTITLSEFAADDGFIICARYSPDEKHIITGGEDGKAIVWDRKGMALHSMVEEGGSQLSMQAHSDMIARVVWLSKDRVATCAYDGVVKIWELEKNDSLILLKTLKGHIKPNDQALYTQVNGIRKVVVRCLDYDPDSDTIVTCGYGGLVMLWPLAKGYQKPELPLPWSETLRLGAIEWNRIGQSFWLIDKSSRNVLEFIPDEKIIVQHSTLSFKFDFIKIKESIGGHHLLYQTGLTVDFKDFGQDSIFLQHKTSGSSEKIYWKENEIVLMELYDLNEKIILIAGSKNGQLAIWENLKNDPLIIDHSESEIKGITILEEIGEPKILVVHADGNCLSYDTKGKILASTELEENVTCVSWHTNLNLALINDKIYDINNGILIRDLCNKHPIIYSRFSLDGKYMLLIDRSGLMTVFKKDGKEIYRQKLANPHLRRKEIRYKYTAIFGPENKYIALATEGETIRFINISHFISADIYQFDEKEKKEYGIPDHINHFRID